MRSWVCSRCGTKAKYPVTQYQPITRGYKPKTHPPCPQCLNCGTFWEMMPVRLTPYLKKLRDRIRAEERAAEAERQERRRAWEARANAPALPDAQGLAPELGGPDVP